MSVINIESAFNTENRSVDDFFNQTGQGLYIPFYQREYSWDQDNIEQLLEDISKGVLRVIDDKSSNNKEIRFLGTIIILQEANKEKIYPVDKQAVPSKIDLLIDGQQRLSTISVIGTLLTKHLVEILSKMKESNILYGDLKEICEYWITQKLLHTFSFDLGRGKPKIKPKIIRGAMDYWVREGNLEKAYKSDLASYLGNFIEDYTKFESTGNIFGSIKRNQFGKILSQNIIQIDRWLKNVVRTAHLQKSDDFSVAWDILDSFKQDSLWSFEREHLADKIKTKDFSSNKSDSYILCELVQVLAVCHYLLDRCCFTIIQPTDEDWAFDMFQSLNATGTPLTAIETFKPLVVNDTVENEKDFKDSSNDLSFREIDNLFKDNNTAQQKNKRTNEFLTSFFVAYSGQSISSHFSYQRKILMDSYKKCNIFDKRSSFIHFLGDYANFYKNIWIDYSNDSTVSIDFLKNHEEGELASVLLLFLRTTGHKMSITVLGSAFKDVIRNHYSVDSVNNFVNIIKAITAYYCIWRSSYPNSGLDSTYREFFKEKNKNWDYNDTLYSQELRKHFINSLKNRGIEDFSTWSNRAINFFRYDEAGKVLCRLAILIAAHDTIEDENEHGLMKIARANTSDFLSLKKWNSLDSVEHIAPQKNTDKEWDSELYDEPSLLYQSIGNLTLLPQRINSSAGNKNWKTKRLYFEAIVQKDQNKLDQLLAEETGLSTNSIEIIRDAEYNEHLKPLTMVKEDVGWNATLIKKRNQRIIEIFWQRISNWLY